MNTGEKKTWEDDIYLEELNGSILPGEKKAGNIGFIVENPGITSIKMITSKVLNQNEQELYKEVIIYLELRTQKARTSIHTFCVLFSTIIFVYHSSSSMIAWITLLHNSFFSFHNIIMLNKLTSVILLNWHEPYFPDTIQVFNHPESLNSFFIFKLYIPFIITCFYKLSSLDSLECSQYFLIT